MQPLTVEDVFLRVALALTCLVVVHGLVWGELKPPFVVFLGYLVFRLSSRSAERRRLSPQADNAERHDPA